MPWTDSDKNLSLFQVAPWFPEDVAKFGIPFSFAPAFFAWMAAASEAIGGLFLALGISTRVVALLIGCTMLVAIFFQKFGGGTWNMLPAMGFLWVSIYSVVLGSGKIGVDFLISQRCF
jgi:putative oxidoreductase